MRDRGFVLVEVLIAAALLVTLAAGLSRIVGAGVREVYSSRARTVATIAAAGKVEELRSLTAGGAVDGVDYLDSSGSPLAVASSPPPSAVYTRRWTVQALADDADVLALQVVVTTRDGALAARLTTVRAPR